MQLPMLLFSILLVYIHACLLVRGQTKILIGNDDGWAVAVIRAQFNALANAGYDVILSCPAVNLSGTGSLSLPPTIVLIPCEFDTCPILSPAEGFNASDPRLNYVNSFPVDAINFGINTLAPELLGGAPDFVVSGPNVGNNLAVLLASGTVGAASTAAKAGIPSAAFSGSSDSLSQVSYTTLDSDPTSTNTNASNIYATLTLKFLDALLSDIIPGPILPPGISLNVNYPAITNCPNEADYQFVLTRLVADSSATDVETCGTTQLPAESDVVALEGCFASVSVFDASTLLDVDAATQEAVLNRLSVFLKCAPSP
ncbi:survival protein sure-like phosphatase/nucleotidase [Lentinula edodes]|uniref:Survival protein sure-like phosphatase/nucleotidase n=1 Tax=Lentinula lateritia TaxID=40482 RepID=A0A9W8ZS57_9AGAR|nr:survival protein sure-like phosphatase/nucleotidase [Lentinula edodes]